MRLGCAAYSFKEYLVKGKMKLEDFIKLVWKLGLDGVELTQYYFPTTENSYLFKLKRLALEHGLEISAVSVGNTFTLPDLSERRKEIEKVKRWIDIAVKMGAPCVRVFAGKVPKGYSEEEAFKWAISALKECTHYAEERGIVLALENHGGITSTASQVLRIIEAVGSEWLRINLDTGNYRVNIYDNIAKSVQYVIHVHAKFLDVAEDGSDKKLDYVRIVDILKNAGYKGYLSIEYEGKEDAMTAVPRVATFLKRLLGKD